MKALQMRKLGIEGLAVAEVPEPQIGADEVLVRIRAISLNFRDLGMVEGIYAFKPELPFIPGSDAAGEVVAIGEAVREFAIGDRVASVFHPEWLSGRPTEETMGPSLGGNRPGVYAELVKFDRRGLVKIPKNLNFEEAATLPCAGLTAWTAMVETGHVKSGDWVLIEGTGGVSIFALQFAVLAGARPIVISSSDEKLEKARQLGAVHTINYRTTPEWAGRVLELTNGHGVDHVVEVAGHATFTQALDALAVGGHLVVIGFLGGASSEIDLRKLMQKAARVEGFSVGHRQAFEDMNRAIEAANLHPVIDRVFKMDQAQDALRHMKAGSHFGKIAIQF